MQGEKAGGSSTSTISHHHISSCWGQRSSPHQFNNCSLHTLTSLQTFIFTPIIEYCHAQMLANHTPAWWKIQLKQTQRGNRLTSTVSCLPLYSLLPGNVGHIFIAPRAFTNCRPVWDYRHSAHCHTAPIQVFLDWSNLFTIITINNTPSLSQGCICWKLSDTVTSITMTVLCSPMYPEYIISNTFLYISGIPTFRLGSANVHVCQGIRKECYWGVDEELKSYEPFQSYRNVITDTVRPAYSARLITRFAISYTIKTISYKIKNISNIIKTAGTDHTIMHNRKNFITRFTCMNLWWKFHYLQLFY